MSFKVLDVEPFWVYGIGTNTLKVMGKNAVFYSEDDLNMIVRSIKEDMKKGPVGGYFSERFDVPRLRVGTEPWSRPTNFSHQVIDIEVVNGQLKMKVRPAVSRSGYALAWIRKNHLRLYTVVSGWNLERDVVTLSTMDLIYNRMARRFVVVDENPEEASPKEYLVKVCVPQAFLQRFVNLQYGIFANDAKEAESKVYDILRIEFDEDEVTFEEGRNVGNNDYKEIDATEGLTC